MTMQLGDDGTLDTVIVCSCCGRELRYNFDGEDESVPFGANGLAAESDAYDRFVDWAIQDATDTQDCKDEE